MMDTPLFAWEPEHEQASHRPPLPLPKLARWQPLRLGLVELYHYDSEEFWFHDGHLLLRGNVRASLFLCHRILQVVEGYARSPLSPIRSRSIQWDEPN